MPQPPSRNLLLFALHEFLRHCAPELPGYIHHAEFDLWAKYNVSSDVLAHLAAQEVEVCPYSKDCVFWWADKKFDIFARVKHAEFRETNEPKLPSEIETLEQVSRNFLRHLIVSYCYKCLTVDFHDWVIRNHAYLACQLRVFPQDIMPLTYSPPVNFTEATKIQFQWLTRNIVLSVRVHQDANAE